MTVYSANMKYKCLVFLAISFSCLCILLGGVFTALGDSYSLALFVVPVLVLYFLLAVIPREVRIGESGFTYKTLLLKSEIDFSEIKAIKSFFSSKSLLAYGGDKNRAHMLCCIRLKQKPFRILLFGDGLDNYKELCSRLQEVVTLQQPKM